jgi:hypothetical protein
VDKGSECSGQSGIWSLEGFHHASASVRCTRSNPCLRIRQRILLVASFFACFYPNSDVGVGQRIGQTGFGGQLRTQNCDEVIFWSIPEPYIQVRINKSEFCLKWFVLLSWRRSTPSPSRSQSLFFSDLFQHEFSIQNCFHSPRYVACACIRLCCLIGPVRCTSPCVNYLFFPSCTVFNKIDLHRFGRLCCCRTGR